MKLWEASDSRKSASKLKEYIDYVSAKHKISKYPDLYRWSVHGDGGKDSFWGTLFDFFEIIHEGNIEPNFSAKTFLDYNWFPNVRLNFAENLLAKGKDSDIALDYFHESGARKETTYKELRQTVARFQRQVSSVVGEGDVVAAYMPNIPETVAAMLATSGLGGIFTSTSSDFGVKGVLDRFTQTKPKVLVSVLSYEYNGKRHSLIPNIEEIVSHLPGIKKVILVDSFEEGVPQSKLESLNAELWSSDNDPKERPIFLRQKFSSPLYIMYSSGTTGKPKCIVHSVGGTLLQHVKELGLHTDLQSHKSIMYYTTCGWMMWNWLVSSLFFGSRVVLYEGSPGYPSLSDFVSKLSQANVNIWGTSPKFLKALEESGYNKNIGFDSLETVLSTGAPLHDEQFDFVYNSIKKDVMLASIAGGTDIISCFMLGNPLLPVYRGEITCRGLGMDVAIFNDEGKAVVGEEGELVCLQSFPSQPVGFWNDDENIKYKESYFNRFEDVWHHGDYVRLSKDGTLKIFGRSDATLNPGGVRIGTAEIYAVVESLSFVEDSLCVGQEYEGDTRILLFVQLGADLDWTDVYEKEIKTKIKSELTARHVPALVLPVSGVPYTRSGKKMETLITKMCNGRTVKSLEALSNPECLDSYKSALEKL